MRCQLGIGLVTAAAAALAPSGARGLELVRTSSAGGATPIRLEVGAQLFARLEGTRIPDADWARAFTLQRAVIGLDVRWGTLLHAQLEPDFGGGTAGLRDAYLELSPLRELDVRVGRTKSPHGKLDNIGRWDLVSVSRGLWSDVLGDRLGFAGRQIAVLPRLRLRDLPLKPWVVGGVLGDLSSDAGADGAAAAGVKLMKGLDAQVSWHHRAGALVDGRHGNAVAAAVTFDRGRWFALAEGTLGRARLLRQDGRASDRDATFAGARARLAVQLPLTDEVSLTPVVGAEVLDPDVGAGSNLGFEVLGGASLRWRDFLRFALEVDAQLGEARFVVADRVQLIAFLGASL